MSRVAIHQWEWRYWEKALRGFLAIAKYGNGRLRSTIRGFSSTPLSMALPSLEGTKARRSDSPSPVMRQNHFVVMMRPAESYGL